MLNLFRQPSRTVPYFIFIAALALSVWLLLRLVLSLQVGFAQMSPGEILGAYAYGLWFDVAALSS